jgi:hypothetical protein
MANNYYLGQTPVEFMDQTPRYFYGITRTSDGFLQLTKINMDTSTEAVSLENLSNVGEVSEIYDGFEEGVDFFEGIDPVTRMPNYKGMNFEQYRWSADDAYYYVNSEGVLCVRVDAPYNYSSGVVTYETPEELFNYDFDGVGVIAQDVNLAFINSDLAGHAYKPLENTVVVKLGLVSDTEATDLALDMGSIV